MILISYKKKTEEIFIYNEFYVASIIKGNFPASHNFPFSEGQYLNDT